MYFDYLAGSVLIMANGPVQETFTIPDGLPLISGFG